MDPRRQTVIINRLKGNHYEQHGEFGPGDLAASVLLDGFHVDVAALFAAAADVSE